MANIDFSKICPRRGKAADWTLYNPILAAGEMGIEYPDTGLGSGYVKIKFGDGITPWNDLAYGVNPTVAHAIYGGTPTSSNDIHLRAGAYDEWITTDPILGDGEIVFDKTNNTIVVGDGAHKFSELTSIKASGVSTDSLDWDFGDEDEDE